MTTKDKATGKAPQPFTQLDNDNVVVIKAPPGAKKSDKEKKRQEMKSKRDKDGQGIIGKEQAEMSMRQMKLMEKKLAEEKKIKEEI